MKSSVIRELGKNGKTSSKSEDGAGDGDRTRDVQLGKLTLN